MDDKERKQEEQQSKKKRGRPVTQEIKLDASPEEVATAIFAGVKAPDPSRRRHNRRSS